MITKNENIFSMFAEDGGDERVLFFLGKIFFKSLLRKKGLAPKNIFTQNNIFWPKKSKKNSKNNIKKIKYCVHFLVFSLSKNY